MSALRSFGVALDASRSVRDLRTAPWSAARRCSWRTSERGLEPLMPARKAQSGLIASRTERAPGVALRSDCGLRALALRWAVWARSEYFQRTGGWRGAASTP